MPRFTALYTDGSTFQGGLTDGSFSGIDQDRLRAFTVTYEGIVASLDLTSGAFTINGETQIPPIAPAPQLIAYATLRNTMGSVHGDECVAFVVGWQATVPVEGQWRNIRLGLRVFPHEGRWEITEAV